MGKKPREHKVFGDWRDLRGAIEAVDPDFMGKSAPERERLWKFAEGLLREYQPFRAECATCGEIASVRSLFRCADCKSFHCEDCIRRHFASTAPATAHALEGA